MHQASAPQPYLVTPNAQNRLGSGQRVFLSPAVWVISVAPRNEFCGFPRKNEASDTHWPHRLRVDLLAPGPELQQNELV